MNKIYIISPSVLLAVFAFFYSQFTKDYAAKIIEKERVVAEAKTAEEAKKKEAEDRARKDADERQKKREAEEAQKAAEKKAKWEAAGKEIADATARYNKDAEKHAKQSAELEIQLSELRAQKEKVSREAFELAKKVELARISKRNAELEVQRMTEMVSRRASESTLTKPPASATTASNP